LHFDLWNRFSNKDKVSDTATKWRSGMRSVIAVSVLQLLLLSSELRPIWLVWMGYMHANMRIRNAEQNPLHDDSTAKWRNSMCSIN